MKFLIIRIAVLIGIAMSLNISVKAQSLWENALLFGRTVPGGSARVQALGGAQTSLGGDYSSASSNPAGLGMFNHSEITFSPGLNFQNASTNYGPNSNSTDRTVFNIPGLSLIIHPDATKTSGFLGGTFGVTVNRINNLNQSYFYQGNNSGSSIIDYMVNYANNNFPSDPRQITYDNISALAYDNYLLDTSSAGGYKSLLSPLGGETRTEFQKETTKRSGSQYQVSIAYGGNFSDKLYFGLSIGFTSIRNTLDRSFTESNFSFSQEPGYNPVNSFKVDENYSVRGSGVNLTAGLIYRPINLVQLGVSIVTPTYYQLTDTYNATVNSSWSDPRNNPTYPSTFDQPDVLNYSLTTPSKLSLGATIFAGKYGFITGDLEFVNYSSARYSDTSLAGVSYDEDNSLIKANLGPSATMNYRVGGEFRYEIFRARAGYNVLGDPYRASGYDRKIQNFTGGVGIKKKKYSLDLAAVYSKSNDIRIPYTVDNLPTPVAQLNFSNLNFVVTVGFTF